MLLHNEYAERHTPHKRMMMVYCYIRKGSWRWTYYILIVNIFSSCQMSPKRVCSSKRKCMIHFRMTIFIFIEGNIIVRHIRNDVFSWSWLFVRPKNIWPPPSTIWSKNNLKLKELTNTTRFFRSLNRKTCYNFLY